jgi:steroid delta-isomerase-like uncharacterized protein
MEENKTIIRDFFTAWNAHDISKATSLLAENCNGGGPEGAKHEFEAFFAAFPDLEVTLEDIVAEDNKVATRSIMRGTQQGNFMGVAATGRSVVMKAHHLFKLEQGKIIQRLGQMDRLELMQQLGMKLVPAQ